MVVKQRRNLTSMAPTLREFTSWVSELYALSITHALRYFQNRTPHGKSLFSLISYICFVVILSDPFTREIMKEFYNTDPLFKEYKYAYGEPKESKHIYVS